MKRGAPLDQAAGEKAALAEGAFAIHFADLLWFRPNVKAVEILTRHEPDWLRVGCDLSAVGMAGAEFGIELRDQTGALLEAFRVQPGLAGFAADYVIPGVDVLLRPGMVSMGVGHAADLGDLIHLCGETGELVGDVDAGHLCFHTCE